MTQQFGTKKGKGGGPGGKTGTDSAVPGKSPKTPNPGGEQKGDRC